MSKIKCGYCGERFDIEREGSWSGPKYGEVCGDCYYESTEECVLCGERFEREQMSDYVLIKWELSGPKPAGIYLVLDYPFLLCPMIGSTSLFESSVLFVDKLPKPDHEIEISGKICEECHWPYVAKLKEGYARSRYWLRHHSRRAWSLERHHTRKVILNNPSMVLDMECSADDYRWKELRETYLLPPMATYREWLWFEWKGVKIYRTDRGSCSWPALSPDPVHRRMCSHSPLVFDPSALPTYRHVRWDRYVYNDENRARRAVTRAISLGIVTQEGVKKDLERTK